MSSISKVEYKIRISERFAVTRYYETEGGAQGSQEIGVYPSADVAYEVGTALAKAEHDRLGFEPGDERIRYPEHPSGAPGLAGVYQLHHISA